MDEDPQMSFLLNPDIAEFGTILQSLLQSGGDLYQ